MLYSYTVTRQVYIESVEWLKNLDSVWTTYRYELGWDIKIVFWCSQDAVAFKIKFGL
jgi:hypothetical protein